MIFIIVIPLAAFLAYEMLWGWMDDEGGEETGVQTGEGTRKMVEIDGRMYWDCRWQIRNIYGPDSNDLRWDDLQVRMTYDVSAGNVSVRTAIIWDEVADATLGDTVVQVSYIDVLDVNGDVSENDVIRLLVPAEIRTYSMIFIHEDEIILSMNCVFQDVA